MARRKKRKKARRTRKTNVLRPFLIILFGFILIAGSYWIYKRFSQREVVSLPKVKASREMTREVNLYFADGDAQKLVGEKREILESPNLVKEIRELLDELIRGPRNKNLARTIPPQARIRSLYLDYNEAVAYVDFTDNITKYSSGGSTGEILSIYSVANSIIGNFAEVKEVKILINGEEAQTLSGHIDLTRAVGFSEGIIKGR